MKSDHKFGDRLNKIGNRSTIHKIGSQNRKSVHKIKDRITKSEIGSQNQKKGSQNRIADKRGDRFTNIVSQNRKSFPTCKQMCKNEFQELVHKIGNRVPTLKILAQNLKSFHKLKNNFTKAKIAYSIRTSFHKIGHCVTESDIGSRNRFANSKSVSRNRKPCHKIGNHITKNRKPIHRIGTVPERWKPCHRAFHKIKHRLTNAEIVS